MNWQILSLFYIVVTIYKSGIFGSPIDSETWVQSYKKRTKQKRKYEIISVLWVLSII